MNELKPCPFCGTVPEYDEDETIGSAVTCKICKTDGPWAPGQESHVSIKRWNERSTHDTVQQDELDDVIHDLFFRVLGGSGWIENEQWFRLCKELEEGMRSDIRNLGLVIPAESPKQTGAVGVERVDDDTVLVNGERFHATEKHGLVVTPEQAVKEYEPHARLMAEYHYGAEHALLNRLIRMLAHLTTTQSSKENNLEKQ